VNPDIATTDGSSASAAQLEVELVTSASIPLALPGLLPDGGTRTWAPTTTTLISGARDAVLVDPPLTTAQADAVLARVQASGRRLTEIVVTHAHGDHWFSAAKIAAATGARVVADPAVIEAMHGALRTRPGFWDQILPAQIPPSPVTAVPVPDNQLDLEGETIGIVPLGHTDTDPTTVVHLPSLALVVAGDVVYDDTHLFLVESGGDGRDQWREALDRLENLAATHLVAGHATRRAPGDAHALIGATRAYLDDVDALLPRCTAPEEFFRAMTRRHPTRANPSTLWGGTLALYAHHRGS